MNVTTITMPKEEALAKLEAYQASRRTKSDLEYQAALEGYQALAEGTPLISLSQAIQNGGFDQQWRPRLAVARADREQVKFSWEARSERALFDSRTDPYSWDSRWPSLFIHAQMGRVHDLWDARHERRETAEGYAMVPLVPPDVWGQLKVKGKAKDYHILWEVEKWADVKKPTPDRDPLLLRRLRGDLYAVIAEWNLTDLERLVMSGRPSA